MIDITGWLFSWTTIGLVAAGLLTMTCVRAALSLHASRQLAASIAAPVLAHGVIIDEGSFSISDDRHVLVVSDTGVAVIDVIRRRLAQAFKHDALQGLKIRETRRGVALTFLIGGGAESRTVHASSMVDVARLMALMSTAGKHIDVVPGE